ncbi:MAG: PQQ-dependent sugar dehydrogenase [Chitinophagaceae bacterium]|nr:PQQ-dependent sugar dehydrogenase [Chitinophagaceae bacterium]
MKNHYSLKGLCILVSLFFSQYLLAQPGNDACASATTLTVTGDCSTTAGTLYQSGSTTVTGGGTCGARADVWYRFTVPANSTQVTITVSLTSNPSTLTTTNTYIEMLNGNTCPATGTSSGGCNNVSQSRTYGGLTGGATYLFRVNTTANITSGGAGAYNFTVCVTSNDNCATATNVTPGTTNMIGSVFGASTSAGVPVDCATGTPDDDVWYRFTAIYSYATITLHNAGSSLTTSGPRMQLFSGACGGLSSLACSNTTNVINATGLTPGNTYYVRVYAAGTGQAGFTATNAGFRISVTPSAPATTTSGRMNEIYHQQIISAPQVLADPWEVTYGPDNNLWVTESKGYRLYRVNPTTGVRDTALDISQGSTFLPVPDQTFNMQFNIGTNNPQGGFAGMALHPDFPSTPYVYVSYVHTYIGGSSPTGTFYTNRLVRFTYSSGTGKLGSPVSLCDSLPGSNDHNSQRIIIAPVGGTNYLFYAAGDMGAGQFGNRLRTMKAQNPNAYEGKILRYNLVSDGDAGLDAWVPNDNPYGATNAVWCIGIRNNQGFAYDPVTDKLYGSSHGPYSDDEINIIEGFRNFGHPLVIGFAADGNYNGNAAQGTNTSISAGAAWTDNSGVSSCPPVGNESTNAATLNASAGTLGAYRDPLFTAYPSTNAGITTIWQTNPGNGGWPSEGWSGLDLYNNTLIPGWKKSLVGASLKWGRLVRLRLNATGTATVPNNAISDTISYFGSVNRFRDLAFGPNGKDMYVIMDRSSTTSGPSAANPIVSACAGCLQKYTFLGYNDNGGKSTIPTTIDVADGTVNTCNTGTTITIDNTNNNIWVPITGPDGNIMAEIHANGNNLGTVTSSFYKNSGAIRVKSGVRYLDRNITITPQNQPGSTVRVRLYLSKAEYDALDADILSGVNAIGDLRILKNNDGCGSSAIASTTLIAPTFAEAHGANGYMLQGNVTSFSSFYFASANMTLPLELLTFSGVLQNNATLLQWETANETNTSHFVVERSIDNATFTGIGTVAANGNSTINIRYNYTDNEVATLPSTVVYYRLKMTDIDGSYTYSNTIVINLADIAGRVTVFPNPASSQIRLMIGAESDGNAQWQILDNAGHVVMQSSVSLRKGNNSVQVDINKLSAGLYYLSVYGNGIDQKVKWQKL